MRFLPILLLLIVSFSSFCQNKTGTTIKLDCPKVLSATDIDSVINVGTSSKILIYCSPVGSGKNQEVSSGKKTDFNYFEKEHNVIWLKLKIANTGNLSIKIKPISDKDDYDFLLFKNEGEASINNIKIKKQKPVRSNLSRNNTDNKGITGMTTTGSNTHVAAGPKNEYSKELPVEKDEEYYLVLDNVYDAGKGAIIEIDYYATKLITGYVSNETKDKKIAAEVTFEDGITGEILQQTTSNPKTGYFEMVVPFVITNPDKMYLLSIDADEYFFEEHTLTTKQILAKDAAPLEVMLPELKKGRRSKIHNINFEGGNSQFVSSATPSLKRLLKLMRKNDKLEIVIEGHTNGCPDGNNSSQLLSEQRALQVKKYLFNNGISENRMATKGYNCEKMLFPNPVNELQNHLNRRVEILVTEY